ncbi:MAG: histidine kinase [Blautia sp.]|nr:histidine kinase [Blautia sp.]
MKRSSSITIKLVLLLVMLILPFNLTSIYTARQAIENAKRQAELNLDSLAGLSMQQLDDRIEASNNFIYYLEEDNKDFITISESDERDGNYYLAQNRVSTYLSNNVNTNTITDGFFWFREDSDEQYIILTSNSETGTNLYTLKLEMLQWLKNNLSSEYAQWTYADINGKQWLIRVCKHENLYYGGLFSLDKVASILKEKASLRYLEVWLCSKNEEIAGFDDKSIMVDRASEKADLQLLLSIPKKEVYEKLPRIQLISLGMAVLYLLLIPILIFNMHRLVVAPLRRIRNAMSHLKNGEQDYRITLKKSSEEFEVIDETFNEMADNIKSLKIENYEKELSGKKMELRNLQLQIRPHFLMNMFNLLYSSAQITDYQSIQKLALYLSDYFRYIFQSGKDLQPFRLEYDLIQQYLEISSMRYPEWYEIMYDIDEEVLDIEIPPLLIHNFIENIFKHVVSYEQKIHIHLEAYVTDKEAVFMIADDGPGMSQEMADNINSGVFPYENEGRVHVGIANSYRRIRYFYDGKGNLSVDSQLGEGTCFTIVLPRGNEDESADR